MLILILETSSEKGCLILAENENPLKYTHLSGGPELSKNLAAEVEKLLNSARPDLIAVGTGPGSYTGIRVGCALAKGLSYGWQIPLIGFCSLKSYGPLPVLVDAKMGGLYALLGPEPTLISPNDPILKTFSKFASPHPEIVQKRTCLSASFQETSPNPGLLAALIYHQFLEGGIAPLELTYLSHLEENRQNL